MGLYRKRKRDFQANHGSDSSGGREEEQKSKEDQRSERPSKKQRSSVDIYAQATSTLSASTSQAAPGKFLSKQICKAQAGQPAGCPASNLILLSLGMLPSLDMWKMYIVAKVL